MSLNRKRIGVFLYVATAHIYDADEDPSILCDHCLSWFHMRHEMCRNNSWSKNKNLVLSSVISQSIMLSVNSLKKCQ
jgi:hypothetical protein